VLSSPRGPEAQLQQEEHATDENGKLVELLQLFRRENRKVEAERKSMCSVIKSNPFEELILIEFW
jgi:hypothetical protein